VGFGKNRDLKAFELLPQIACRQNQDRLKNKTATSSSEKQNAVLTLPRDANYNSCRTQNSSRTEFGVDGCGGLVSCARATNGALEEATG
jgi:hypothetical protein